MITVLATLLALSTGWAWGHSTARIRHIPIGATQAADDDALLTQAIADLNTTCCDRWWTSAGTDHDPVCPNSRRSSTP